MRFFALETNAHVLQKKFLVEGEHAALITHRHWLAFVVSGWWPMIGGGIALAGLMTATAIGIVPLLWYTILLTMFLVSEGMLLFGAYAQWRYNFFIVTTQKIVIVEQRTFYQQIQPMPFESISNTRVESQFLGLFRCGIVHINTMVPERGGLYHELPVPFLPKPENIAAVIENGLVLTKQPPEAAERQKQEKMQEPAVQKEVVAPA